MSVVAGMLVIVGSAPPIVAIRVCVGDAVINSSGVTIRVAWRTGTNGTVGVSVGGAGVASGVDSAGVGVKVPLFGGTRKMLPTSRSRTSLRLFSAIIAGRSSHV